MTQHELRDRLGYVPQKGVLFSGTIDSNIRYGKPDMPEEDVKLAAQIAQSDDFIEAKPEGYKAPISQGGNNVSGGQKQRLSIARAIAKKPEILIFDDSFSALDFKTDSKLRKALKEKTKDITTIIVAQRISTILNADQIIVLDDGNMAGIGTHKELMKGRGLPLNRHVTARGRNCARVKQSQRPCDGWSSEPCNELRGKGKRL